MTDDPARVRRPRTTRWLTAPLSALAMVAAFAVPILAFPEAAGAAPLRTHATARNKFIGFALNVGQINNAPYRNLGATEFNQVTAENAMKFSETHPNPGNQASSYNFTGADQVMAFAEQNNQQVHGHTFVWHQQTSGWIQSLPGAEMLTAMRQHIATVGGRYANNPRLTSWDVVNEAFEENGNRRQSFWMNINNATGMDYIAEAFRAARAADPDADLCYNDFNIEGMNAKSNAVFAMVQQFQQQGVPIDCLGIQGHLAIQFSFPGQVAQNLARFAQLGLRIRFTELDVRMQNPRDASKDQQAASYFTQIIQACNNQAACDGVTIWGISDNFSWIPDTFPNECCGLLWDANFQAKPQYTAVHNALDNGQQTDTTPPSTPGTLSAAGTTSTSTNLSWGASTDNVGVAGYNILRATGATGGTFAVVGTTTGTGTTTTSGGLTANTTYRFQVQARDAAGNTSPVSNTVTVTTTGGTTNGCTVTYVINWTGGNGFGATARITNNGTSAINGWSLNFSLPAGQTFGGGWNGNWPASGAPSPLTVTSQSWNASIPAGGTLTQSPSFNGTYSGSGTPARPAAFTLNGSACTIA
jgi:endo-1,4-beta-xylanase